MQIIAELATNHGGDVGLAEEMVCLAAEAGADYVKTQAYTLARLNQNDAQAEWLRQSHLDAKAHQRLMRAAERAGAKYLVTPFDADALKMLKGLGQSTFKIASSEAGRTWWRQEGLFYVSWPWGAQGDTTNWAREWGEMGWAVLEHLTAIPLYPTPLECVMRATPLGGWSDHCLGLSACEYAIANGAKVLEVHFKIEGKGRNCVFDKSADDIRRLRAFADDCATITSGVATRFRNRWKGAA